MTENSQLAEFKSQLALVPSSTAIVDPRSEEIKQQILEQAEIFYQSSTLSRQAADSGNRIIDLAESLIGSDPRSGAQALGFVFKHSQVMTAHHQRAARVIVDLIKKGADPVPAIEFAMELTHHMNITTPAFQEIRLEVLRHLPAIEAPQEWKAGIVDEIYKPAPIGSALHQEAEAAQKQYGDLSVPKHLAPSSHSRVKILPPYEGKQ
jgi:hypothetical protein